MSTWYILALAAFVVGLLAFAVEYWAGLKAKTIEEGLVDLGVAIIIGGAFELLALAFAIVGLVGSLA